MSAMAHVGTEDLGQVLDYLDGLQEILQRLDDDGVGRDAVDPLVATLEGIHHYSEGWAGMRYQVGVGQGWQSVSQALAELRERLLDGYTRAAL